MNTRTRTRPSFVRFASDIDRKKKEKNENLHCLKTEICVQTVLQTLLRNTMRDTIYTRNVLANYRPCIIRHGCSVVIVRKHYELFVVSNIQRCFQTRRDIN